ncbi:type II secretion system F family protein [Microbacterium radiodurans]|uniref:Pilus assembly protein TadB n=1 Tax=Microbacterium radiodurans TaxID=661398 RepID=A0A5J5INS4_9MICO|nr:type II secretion system F family protein [Microbacterium radiodurans]KAA9085273.1 pilus assembly protein TadB [Microbacterium radiodurans]
MRSRRRASGSTPAEAGAATVASTLQRIAVLLEAGIAPDVAWRHLAASGDATASAVVSRRDAGTDLAGAIAARGGAWRDAGAAWQVASTVGAPLAHSLRVIAEAVRAAERTRDDIRVALAEPAATARLVAWLPLVAVALSVALGFDPVATVAHPLGAASLTGGAALMMLARFWTRRLVARAQPSGEVAGLSAEMLAIALSGGVSIERAERVLQDAGGAVDPAARAVLQLSAAAGAPAVELLRASADLDRHEARVAGRLRAAELSSRLLIPLGVCTLPAFLLVGVVPMLLGVLTATPMPL